MDNKNQITQLFQGMDSDSILERVKQGSYIDGENLRIGPGPDGQGGAARPLGGTGVIQWAAPAGVNTGIGTFWDRKGDTLVVFVHNSQGNHSIIWHHPGEASARTITRPGLDFVKGSVVASCELINGRDLVFTDDETYIKCIDLRRADETGKKSVVRLYLPPSSRIVDFRQFLNVGITLNGNPVGSTFSLPNATAQDVRDFVPMVRNFAANWNANATLRSAFEAKGCGRYVELTATNAGMYGVRATVRDFIATAQQPDVQVQTEFRNRYNGPLRPEQVMLGTIKPAVIPGAVLASDPARPTSLLERRQWQACIRYRFQDKRNSLYGPLSDIALPLVAPCLGSTDSSFNCIDFTFDDMWLRDEAIRGEIDHVEIVVKYEDDGAYFLARTIDKWEWMYSRTFRFYNDQAMAGVPKEAVIAGSTFLPPRARALTLLTDHEDSTRVVTAGGKEGDPTPCLDIVGRVVIDGSLQVARPTVTVTGKIWIVTCHLSPGSPYERNQPIGIYDAQVGPVFGGMSAAFHTSNPEAWRQRIPTGGFVVYAAGTDLLCITKQSLPGTSFQCGTNYPTVYTQPGAVWDGRNVYDLTATGNNGSGFGQQCGDEKRAAARHAIELSTDGVYQEFNLTGLVPGETYIIRVASHLCDYDTGDKYDLNSPTRAWQGTSTRLFGMGSTAVPGVVEPDFFECVIRVPLNAGGTTIDIGNCFVADFTSGNALGLRYGIEAYVRDTRGLNHGAIDIRDYIPAERQVVTFHDFITGNPVAYNGTAMAPPVPAMAAAMTSGITFTDHNGYAFFWGVRTLGLNENHPRMGWLSNTGIPGTGGVINNWGANITTTYTVCNDASQDKWEGEFGGVLNLVNNNLANGAGSVQYFVPNLNQSTSHIRTTVRMLFQDPLGNPIEGVRAMLAGNHATPRTSDNSGVLEIYAYADNIVNNDDRNDSLIFGYSGTCGAVFSPASVQVAITQFEAGLQWSEQVPYVVPTVVVTLSGQSGRSLGRGSSRIFGIYGERANGDRTPVMKIFDAAVPLLVQDLNLTDPLAYPISPTFSSGAGRIEWEILGDVPEDWTGWGFTHFQLCMTGDTTRDWWFQWCASAVTYSSIWTPILNDPEGGEPTNVGYASGTATEIYISLSDSTKRYNEINTGSIINLTDPNVAYQWSRGDMLRVLTYSDGSPMNGRVVDVPITGQRGRWITIEAKAGIPELKGGELIEVYRPMAAKPIQTFYDIPGGRIDIIDPFGPNPSWSATSGTVYEGDTWILSTRVPIRPSALDHNAPTGPWLTVSAIRESKWQSDFFPSTGYGKGKPHFMDPSARTQETPHLMRYSDPFKPDTGINGINLFGGFAYRRVENMLGKIMSMQRMGNVIFCVCERGCFSIYVGMQQTQTSSDWAVELGGGILGNVRPFEQDFGTQHPLSVVRTSTAVFFYDRSKAEWVQHNSQQLQDKARQELMHSWFSVKSTDLPDDAPVCAGWDMAGETVILSFPPVNHDVVGSDGNMETSKVPEESMHYHDPSNRFVCRMGYKPDCWGMTRQRLWSFKDGVLLLHDAPGAGPNLVNGVQLEMSVTTVFVGDERTNKIPETLSISRGAPGWEVEMVTASDPRQRSMIPASKFDTRRGAQSSAEFLMDTATPLPQGVIPLQYGLLSNGDELMSPAFAVKIVWKGQGPCLLLNATMAYNPVEVVRP